MSMDIIEINEKVIEKEHICCALGNDKVNRTRSQRKKDWLKEQFSNGLVFKRLNDRGKVFIEYMPIEHAWKPIEGSGYIVINCLWVSGKFKKNGYAKELLNSCINDAKSRGMNGICVVSSSKVKPFLTDKRFYIKNGFVTVDTVNPYFELLALKFNDSAVDPKFTQSVKDGKNIFPEGFTFTYSDQCPFMEDCVYNFMNILSSRSIKCQSIKLETSEQARKIGSPFGTLGIYYNGEFITHELMTDKKFHELVDNTV